MQLEKNFHTHKFLGTFEAKSRDYDPFKAILFQSQSSSLCSKAANSNAVSLIAIFFLVPLSNIEIFQL